MSGPIIIAAGGTGGHMFPALALARLLRTRGHEVKLMTDQRAAKMAQLVFAPGNVYVLPGAGIAGRGLLRGVAALGALARGVMAARKIFLQSPPCAVIGFGGYPSVAPVFAARFVKPRPLIVLHEQNAVFGRANRRLAGMADVVALTFETTLKLPSGAKTVITGNPVRDEIAAKSDVPYDAPVSGPIRLLIIGGSLGAKVFSKLVPPALAALPEELRGRLVVTQQAREDSLNAVPNFYQTAGIEARVSSFFEDVAGLMANAHLVISRAGASSVAEIAAIGRPAILIPLPDAIDDHQTENCRALVKHQAAVWMPQPMLNSDLLATLLADFLAAPERLAAMAKAAHDMARLNATHNLADLIEQRLAARIAA
jgi:UDP-N-acetylglucosamine--N-acetylmuramyl-(pentapeptide) pyrophosphoryl-undecaprenol N-acetylglucosamine transferase